MGAAVKHYETNFADSPLLQPFERTAKSLQWISEHPNPTDSTEIQLVLCDSLKPLAVLPEKILVINVVRYMVRGCVSKVRTEEVHVHVPVW